MAALLSAGLLAGCGIVHAASHPVSHQAPPAALTWIGEPQAGFRPWAAALRQAKTGVDVNAYLLTDTAYADALKQLAQRGIAVRVILAANPYHDATAVATERRLFAGSRVQLHWAPARFDRPYATDHAKYLVVNPGTPHALAIMGSPNGTWSAFGGWNAEDAIETTAPALTQALTAVFHADWTGRSVGSAVRRTLVLSPGATGPLVQLLRTPGPVAIATEELGDVPTLYASLAAHGATGRLLIPLDATQSAKARQWLAALARAGVQVRTLATPYVHAKLMITAHQTWVGSQNWSEPSLMNNREVGLITTNAAIHAAALTWFNGLWHHAHGLR
jgi:phosphatidylserine/phosphatidylglycerophosphate/cardiolipin synthase-like enzyme